MYYSESFKKFFIVMTIIVIGTVSLTNIGHIDLQAMISTGIILIPAIFVMGFLGQKIGEIVDNPKNKDDADYKISVLNALKKMDKSITLQELNEKLTQTVSEPDSPEVDSEEDVDV